MQHTFTLTKDHIPLNQLLKLLDVAENGFEIKNMITE
jgi:ribosome-associated protein YbcJ (S4-like RNA binding protein)